MNCRSSRSGSHIFRATIAQASRWRPIAPLAAATLPPRTPLTGPGFHDDQIPLLTKLVANARARERMDALLRMANAVLCASPGLWRVRRARRDDAHCIADSVDASHFSCAADARLAHPAVKTLPRPRLGYAGVIDERIDCELLRAAAQARPDKARLRARRGCRRARPA